MGETYPRVVGLLKREFEEKKVTKYAFCKKTGINPTSVDRYLCGISEPTYASLQKLSEYFNVSIPWLRGEDDKEQKTKIFFDEKLARKLFNLMEDYCLQNKLSQENKSSLFLKVYIYFNSNEKKPSTKSEVEQLLKEFQEGL